MTTRKRQKRRRWLMILGVIGLTPLLMVLLLPVWFPWILGPVLNRQGISFQKYERVGLQRIRLSGVQADFSGISFEAERLETWLPTGLVWNRLFGRDQPATASVSLERWRLVISETASTEPTTAVAMAEVFEQVKFWGDQVGAWLPRIEALDGEIELLGTEWSVRRLTGAGSSVLLEFTSPLLPSEGAATAELKVADGIDLQAALSAAGVSVSAALTPVGNGWSGEGQILLGTDAVRLGARWGAAGLLPETAQVEGNDIPLPIDLLPDLDLPIASALADLNLEWAEAGWKGRVDVVMGLKGALAEHLGSVRVQLGANGTLDGATLSLVEIGAEAGTVKLDRPLELAFASPWLTEPAEFSLESDLGTLPQLAATGTLNGRFMATTGPPAPVTIDYHLELGETSWLGGSLRSRSTTMSGVLAWPVLEVAQFESTMASGGDLRVQGSANLAEGALSEVTVGYQGAPPYDLTPLGIEVAEVQLNLTVSGVWPEIEHAGSARGVGVAATGIALDAVSLDWEGIGPALDRWNALVQREEAEIAVAGETHWRLDRALIETRIPTLEWRNGEAVRFSLAKPFDLIVGIPSGDRDPFIQCGPLEWIGPEEARLVLETDVAWPTKGKWHVAIEGFDLATVRDFIDSAVPAIRLDELVVAGEWDNGPVLASARISASRRVEGLPEPVVLDAVAGLGTEGLTLDRANLGFGSDRLLTLKGRLPFQVEPGRVGGMIVVDHVAPLDLGLESARSDVLGAWLSELLPLQVEEPRVELAVTGTLAKPVAWANVGAARIHLSLGQDTEALPDLEQLSVKVQADFTQLEVVEGSFSIRGQPGKLTGKFELGAEDVSQWIAELSHPDWNRFSGRVELKDAEISAFAEMASEVIMPRGTLSLELGIAPGLELQGRCEISGVDTRPMPPFASLRDANVLIEFEGYTAHIRSAKALYGGQPVSLTGFVQRNGNELPFFDLTITGNDLSVVRNEGMFVRADADLRVSHLTNSVPKVAGVIGLRDSLLFKDLRSLLDIDLMQPTRRPPFFSVTAPPFDEWLLDVRVEGDRFMRVRSPVFRGEMSMGMVLMGTLSKPIAVGDVTVPTGQIVFPFGVLDLDRGRVHLTEEDPYRPKIDVQGSGYNFGYLVRFDLTGTTDRPDLLLNSVPPLTPKEIILMLSAGEVPDQRISYSSTDKASRIGLYLGKEILNQFLGSGESASRLTIRTGEQVAEDGSVTYGVEYKLSERWSAIGEYSRFKDINTGLKFKVFSR